MSCIYCRDKRDFDRFDIHYNEYSVTKYPLDEELKKRVSSYSGNASLYGGSIIKCSACGSRWTVTTEEHRLPPDTMPWYYTVTIEWKGQA